MLGSVKKMKSKRWRKTQTEVNLRKQKNVFRKERAEELTERTSLGVSCADVLLFQEFCGSWRKDTHGMPTLE
jgi:hypothetical protein